MPPGPSVLVLSGGGVLGAWHAGVLSAIPPDKRMWSTVYGSSVGALNGAILTSAGSYDAAIAYLVELWCSDFELVGSKSCFPVVSRLFCAACSDSPGSAVFSNARLFNMVRRFVALEKVGSLAPLIVTAAQVGKHRVVIFHIHAGRCHMSFRTGMDGARWIEADCAVPFAVTVAQILVASAAVPVMFSPVVVDAFSAAGPLCDAMFVENTPIPHAPFGHADVLCAPVIGCSRGSELSFLQRVDNLRLAYAESAKRNEIERFLALAESIGGSCAVFTSPCHGKVGSGLHASKRERQNLVLEGKTKAEVIRAGGENGVNDGSIA